MHNAEQIRFYAREYLRLANKDAQIDVDIFATLRELYADSVEGLFLPPYFLHRSQQDSSQVAYTPTEKHGFQDRQVRTTIGRALRKLIPQAKDHEIASVANLYRTRYGKQTTLKFATTRDDIARVYKNAHLGSCMGGPDKGSQLIDEIGFHPCEVYAHSSLAVAYIEREGRITARCVVNQLEQYILRIYGDDETMLPLLKKAGYSPGTLEGCSILKLRNSHGDYIAPYIDGEYNAVIDQCSETWELVAHGGMIASDHQHCLLENSPQCEDCGEHATEDDMHMTYNEQQVCQNCVENSYMWSEHEGTYIHEDCAIQVYIGRWDTAVYHESSYVEYIHCEGTGELYDDAETAEMHGVYEHSDGVYREGQQIVSASVVYECGEWSILEVFDNE